MGRGTLKEVWDGSGDRWGGPVRVWRPSGRSRTGRGTLGEVQNGRESLGEVQDGSIDP